MKDHIISALHTVQGATSSSYVVRSRIKGGKAVAITIGKTSIWSLSGARKEAQKILLELSQGFNRNQDRKKRQAEEAMVSAKSITLRQALAKYVDERPIKASTKHEYRLVIEREFREWLDKPITSITKDAVATRYIKIIKDIKAGKTVSKGKTNTRDEDVGVGEANHSMRILSAVIGYFVGDAGDPDDSTAVLTYNPVKQLRKKKMLRKLKHRDRRLNKTETRILIEECSHVRHPEYKKDGLGLSVNAADFAALLLLLACRRGELVKLKWSDVHFAQDKDDVGTVTLRDTKNGKDHTLAITPVAFNILKARKAENKTNSEWVFPSTQRNKLDKHISCGRIVESVAKKLNINGLTAHVLRRTTANVANELGYDLPTIKMLLNHSASGVTEIHYVHSDKQRLLEMQLAIENAMFNDGEPPDLEMPEF